MRIGTVTWLLGVTVSGCASATPPRSPRPAPLARPLPAPSVSTDQSTETVALPPPLVVERAVACTFTAAGWPNEPLEDVGAGRVYLRFVAGGPAFAELFFGTGVRLELPSALASAGGTVTLDAHGVSIQGHLEAAEMPLYPGSVFVMSDVFIPNHQLRLLWRSARPGFITVATAPLHRVEPYAPEFTAERECRDISLGQVILDDAAIDAAMGATPQREPPRKPWPWLRSGRVPFSALPGAGLVATLDAFDPRDDTRTISPPRVLSVDTGYTRVAVNGFGGVLFGWVPGKQVTTSTLQYLDLSHDALSVLAPPRPRAGNFVTCDHDVPLVAEAGGERRLVGSIRKGTRLEPLGTLAAWRRLELPDAGFTSVEGASFWSRAVDLAGCGR